MEVKGGRREWVEVNSWEEWEWSDARRDYRGKTLSYGVV